MTIRFLLYCLRWPSFVVGHYVLLVVGAFVAAVLGRGTYESCVAGWVPSNPDWRLLLFANVLYQSSGDRNQDRLAITDLPSKRSHKTKHKFVLDDSNFLNKNFQSASEKLFKDHPFLPSFPPFLPLSLFFFTLSILALFVSCSQAERTDNLALSTLRHPLYERFHLSRLSLWPHLENQPTLILSANCPINKHNASIS